MKRLTNKLFFAVLISIMFFCAYITAAVYVISLLELWIYTKIAILGMALLVLAVLIYLFVLYFTKRLIKPLNELDLEAERKLPVYAELKPFEDNLKEKSNRLEKQMKKVKREHNIQDKVRREFTANVSHELKTPLTSISGYAEIMKNGLVKDEDMIKFSEIIYNETARLITLVGDIIKLSRLDENAIKEQKQIIELCSLCESVISRLEVSAKQHNIKFELIGTKTAIFGIERIIDEMIYNLCDNAIKYNKDGGKVKVSVMQTYSEAVLSVSDTGIGIEKSDAERVFERFYRVNKSHSKEIGGTGLGLSIVKHGAAVHNAEVEIDSTVGVGTTFIIRFPLQ